MLGTRLRQLRTRKGRSQGQIAEYAKVPQSTLSDFERGDVAPKTVGALINLAEYFGCSVDYLLGLTNDPQPANKQSMSEAAVDAINLIDSLPPEKRSATVAVLRAIIVLMDVGVPLPQEEPELVRSDGSASTKAAPTWEVGADKSHHRQLGLPVMEEDEWTSVRKDALLALLKTALPEDEFEKLKESVDAGRPLSESELFRLRQILGNQGLQQPFKLPDDTGTVGDG